MIFKKSYEVSKSTHFLVTITFFMKINSSADQPPTPGMFPNHRSTKFKCKNADSQCRSCVQFIFQRCHRRGRYFFVIKNIFRAIFLFSKVLKLNCFLKSQLSHNFWSFYQNDPFSGATLWIYCETDEYACCAAVRCRLFVVLWLEEMVTVTTRMIKVVIIMMIAIQKKKKKTTSMSDLSTFRQYNNFYWWIPWNTFVMNN